ncbi:MAG: right-handed parallel beta-helix repeat-containing protein [Erysipelotrichaceae bacterium]|nr:right-handed parallel beta-helix repeat-containing protein [Erysipelotrichaceae bacterium]
MKSKFMIIVFLIFFVMIVSGCEDNRQNIIPPIINEENDSIETEEPKGDTNIEVDGIDVTTEIEEKEKEIVFENSIFVCPNGNGTGTYDNPYSLENGIQNLTNDKTLYLLSGTYNVSSVIRLTLNGSLDSYYKIYAYKDEKVILDFGKDYSKEQALTGNYNSEKAKGIVIKGTYYHIKGIIIKNCGAQGLQISGSYNIVENCVFANNGNTGCGIGGASNKAYNEWPHDNLIKNCTSYGNYDWDRLDDMQGEDADGFGCKLTTGPNNVFDGCIAYNNSDDGWDLFTKHLTGPIGSVTIKNSIAFSNGFSLTGESMKNGNGFKLGGRAIEVSHLVENCIAFYNKANGFDDNSNPGTITLKKCTSYLNGTRNYAMGRFLEENNTYSATWYEGDILFGPVDNVPKSHNVFVDCISYSSAITDSYCGTANNSYFFNQNNKYVVFDALSVCNSKYSKGNEIDSYDPFVSTNINLDDLENIHYEYRNNDYSINLNNFLKLKNNFNIGASF